jgi:sec-independent protein translocase protein TatB
MTQFQVGDTPRASDPHDPIQADRCKDLKDMGELFKPPRPNNSGRGNAEDRGEVAVSTPAEVAAQAQPAAPGSAPAAPKPAVRVLGSKRKSKVKVKVKSKARKPAAKKPATRKPAAKKTTAKKLGARRSPSARALKVRRGK